MWEQLQGGFLFGLIFGCMLYIPLFIWHAHRIKRDIDKTLGR